MRGTRENRNQPARNRGFGKRNVYFRNRYNNYGNYNAKNNKVNITNTVYNPNNGNDDKTASHVIVLNNSNEQESHFCGWNLYFPSIPLESKLKRSVEIFKQFLNHLSIDLDIIEKKLFLNIDYQFVVNSEFLKNKLIHFEALIKSDPQIVIKQFSLALHSLIYDCNKKTANIQKEGKTNYVSVRIINFEPIIYNFNLKADQLGSFVAFQGTVIRISPIKPVCIRMKFKCAACTQEQVLVLPEGYRFAVPIRCLNQICRSKTFEPIKESEDTWTIDYQTIKLQECNQELTPVQTDSNTTHSRTSTSSTVGGIPRTLNCILTRTLVDSCVPGDRVLICGILAAESAGGGTSTTNISAGTSTMPVSQCLFDLVVHVNSLIRMKETNQNMINSNSSNDISHKSINTDDAENYHSEFNVKELYGIKAIHEEPNLFKLLVASLCPNIFGHELVKTSLLLALFGGVTKYNSGSRNRVVIRGNCHVLIVGDPGLGKSQMLQFACAVAPRSVYVCGSTASAAGLTVTFCKDSSSDSSLEAGALLISDQGCCCIDEFDKMSVQQHASLLEAMEQQSISVAKAGIVCNLSARTSILAAANPVTGHYDKSKTVSENLKLSAPLLSRFDLVYIMLDRPDEVLDSKLSRHVLALHATNKSRNSSQPNLNSSIQMNVKQFKSIAESGGSNTSIQERLSYSHNEPCEPIPIPLLQKYIAYARKFVNPKLSPEAADVLKDFYLSLRKRRNLMDGTPITTRQLESLIRMTEARARAELREVATQQDALDVKELMLESMLGVYSDEFGIMNFSRSQSGRGMSKATLSKKFVAVLQKKAEQKGSSLFPASELKEIACLLNIPSQDIEQIITNLNQQGFLLKRGPKMYQLLTAGF